MRSRNEEDVKTRTNLINKIKKELKNQKIDIDLYIGTEIYISENLEEQTRK